MAWLAPSHMCVHPTFGPWMALRAAIVIDVEGPPPRAPIAPPCDCATGCQAALDRALAARARESLSELRERWKLWLAVRDACPVGRAHRYDDDQIRYHYAGDLPSRS
jgi:methylmalonic aciduria homocystinuria type C protein